jgi:aarF domain-containing kinase
VRPHPSRLNDVQIVLLDHGLYVRLRPEFRRQYAVLWRGLLTLDQEAITDVTRAWGFGAPDLFASATLMRPVKFSKKGKPAKEEKLSDYELGQKMKKKLREFLSDTDAMPKELAFIGRNMRIMQG